MAQATTLTLLSQLSYNDSRVVSNSFTGAAQPAASFYMGNKDLQTVTWVFSGVTATVSIQATLAENPTNDDWFTIHNNVVTTQSLASFENLRGNYVYLRVIVRNFTAGVIQNMKVSY